MQSFFMIWNPQGKAPTFKHLTRGQAEAEADRLAQCNPGHTFVILESVGQVVTKTTQFTPHERNLEDEIPF